MNITLARLTLTPQGTSGLLSAGELRLFTIELPWDDNAPDESCAPTGTYALVPFQSVKHGATWQLSNPELNIYAGSDVPPGGRFAIEIHIANYARELLGCIGVGLAGEPMLDPTVNAIVPAVQDSRQAMIELRAVLGLDPSHTITISTGAT